MCVYVCVCVCVCVCLLSTVCKCWGGEDTWRPRRRLSLGSVCVGGGGGVKRGEGEVYSDPSRCQSRPQSVT